MTRQKTALRLRPTVRVLACASRCRRARSSNVSCTQSTGLGTESQVSAQSRALHRVARAPPGPSPPLARSSSADGSSPLPEPVQALGANGARQCCAPIVVKSSSTCGSRSARALLPAVAQRLTSSGILNRKVVRQCERGPAAMGGHSPVAGGRCPRSASGCCAVAPNSTAVDVSQRVLQTLTGRREVGTEVASWGRR